MDNEVNECPACQGELTVNINMHGVCNGCTAVLEWENPHWDNVPVVYQ